MSHVLEALTPASHTLAFARPAPTGLHGSSGTLLCLSASFNPLTRAHWGLVANADKTIAGLPLAVRLALLERFAQSRPTVSVAATGPGRFIDKLSVIRTAYPAGTRIVFLLGFDTLVRLCDPKYYQDRDAALATLFAGCECVVAGRPPDPPEAVAVLRSTPPLARYQSRIHAVQLPTELAPITATATRAQLAKGEVPDSVPEEIRPLLAAWAVAHRVVG